MIWAILFACNGDKGDTALDTAAADTGPIPNPLADVDSLEDQLLLNTSFKGPRGLDPQDLDQALGKDLGELPCSNS